MKTDEKLLLAFVGVAIVGGIIYFATKAPAAAASTPPATTATPPAARIPPTLPGPIVTTPVAPAVQHIVVSPGVSTVTASIGSTISVELPPGGAWQAGGTAVMPAQVGTSAPITWVYNGPGTIIVNWSSPTMGTKQTQITFQTM